MTHNRIVCATVKHLGVYEVISRFIDNNRAGLPVVADTAL
jgi:hypothetical protein